MARRLFCSPRTVALASGTEYVDALIAGAHSGRVSAPVLLVRRDSVPAAVARYLREHRAGLRESTLVGGESRVSDETLRRLSLLTVR